jgi:hypothetical protein
VEANCNYQRNDSLLIRRLNIFIEGLTSLHLVLGLHITMVGFWWGVAAVQSEDQNLSHHCIPKYCYSGCSMCSDHVLGRGSVNQEGFSVTRVCHCNCCRRRKVQYIFHEKDGLTVVSLILLLSGDVEANPGPGKVHWCMDFLLVCHFSPLAQVFALNR